MNLVKQSLVLCIGVLLALVALMGLQSLWQVARLSGASEHLAASSRIAGTAQQLWQRFADAEDAFRQSTAFTDVEGADARRRRFDAAVRALHESLSALKDGSDADMRGDIDRIAGRAAEWLALAAPHVSGDTVTELPAYHRLEALRAGLSGDVAALVARSRQAADTNVAAVQATARTAQWSTVVELVLAVALGVALGWFALRNLRRQLGADATEVARVVNAVADGDLTVPIRADGLPADSVMAAAARMQRSLATTVEQVRGISAHLAAGAREIATGNSDLSARTEQQAAALERTASTMEQLGATVRLNADGAARASELAGEASQVAARGGQVVADAVRTMQGIHESSRRIADITGVIDGIAFQTNILALNAAVEAARAGDQGRGFAVVAGEVRTLAQRSAQAAREIKGLIGESVERVGQGTALVDRAGATMQEVVGAIGRVTAVMEEIRHASAEQSQGVAQVGEAVTQMDRSTQQNAALAEQSAAASAQLQDQSGRLVEAVAFFRTAAGPAQG